MPKPSKKSRQKSSSDDLDTLTNGSNQPVSEYEKQRLQRISDNKKRMEALGLRQMASALMGSMQNQAKRKGKAKVVDEEDEEYTPCEADDDGLSSSSDNDDDDDDDDEFLGSGSRARKVQNKNSKPKKKVPIQKILRNSEVVVDDDDAALMQAIALSLQDSGGVPDVVQSGPSQGSEKWVEDATLNKRKGNVQVQEDTGRRKKKKSINSRVQMTEDELILHFFQFDVAGKGGITLRDLQKVANAHDFTWTDKEMADMIHCFDSDGDGMLNLDDFRGIASRCNMIRGSENAVMSSKS